MILFLVRSYKDRDGPRTRQEILNAIRANPGLTKTELCRSLDLAWGTVYHHLRVLADDNHVVERKGWRWRRFYLPDMKGAESLLLPLLREGPVPQILSAVEEQPGIGIGDLSEHLSLSRKVVRRHLTVLVGEGVLQRTPEFRARYFLANPRPPHEGQRPG